MLNLHVVLWQSFSHLLNIDFFDFFNIAMLETQQFDRLDSESDYLSDGVLILHTWRTDKILISKNIFWWIWYQNQIRSQKLMNSYNFLSTIGISYKSWLSRKISSQWESSCKALKENAWLWYIQHLLILTPSICSFMIDSLH